MTKLAKDKLEILKAIDLGDDCSARWLIDDRADPVNGPIVLSIEDAEDDCCYLPVEQAEWLYEWLKRIFDQDEVEEQRVAPNRAIRKET